MWQSERRRAALDAVDQPVILDVAFHPQHPNAHVGYAIALLMPLVARRLPAGIEGVRHNRTRK